MTQDFRPDEPESSDGGSGGGPPLAILGGLAAAVVVGIIVVVIAFGGGDGDGSATGQRATPTSADASAGLATGVPDSVGTPLVGPTVGAAPNLTSVGAGDRLMVAKFGINAPLTYRAVGTDGIMANPNGPDDVAYYNFAAWPGKGGAPGQGGNSVFAGHVDSGRVACKNGSEPPPCQAVFWDIGRLAIGDEVEVVVGGSSFKYRVTSNQAVNAQTGDWDGIVSARAQESITLITCGGDFNTQTREYSHRQVVVAVRI